jgi:hypothetical protein
LHDLNQALNEADDTSKTTLSPTTVTTPGTIQKQKSEYVKGGTIRTTPQDRRILAASHDCTEISNAVANAFRMISTAFAGTSQQGTMNSYIRTWEQIALKAAGKIQ